MGKLRKSTNGMSRPNNFPIPFSAIPISFSIWHHGDFTTANRPIDGIEPHRETGHDA
ncbi:hypothetical protein SAMN05446635_2443 [Burkholderia sp. OK233]|nr:hypothetical protein SAMN05446635_2443 [Burkholderia sp. OK233]